MFIRIPSSSKKVEEAFVKWQKEIIALLSPAIDEALTEASRELAAVILNNPINASAFPYIFSGDSTKAADICLKTMKQGLFKGLIKACHQ